MAVTYRLTPSMEQSVLRIQQHFEAREPIPIRMTVPNVIRTALESLERAEQIQPIEESQS